MISDSALELVRFLEGAGGAVDKSSLIENVQPELFGIETTGDVYVNEDGKSLGLPVNPHVNTTEFDVLVGNILIEEKI